MPHTRDTSSNRYSFRAAPDRRATLFSSWNHFDICFASHCLRHVHCHSTAPTAFQKYRAGSRVGCEHPNCPDSFQLPHQLFIFISTVMPFSYRRLFFGGTTFCCCLPVRLGVIVMSSLGCLVAGILMILLWFELASTSQSSLGFIRCYISKYSILILLSDIVHDDPRTRGICSRCVDSDSPFCSVHSRVRFPGIKDCYKIKN